MNKSELKALIKEEIKKVLNEDVTINESVDPEILSNLLIGLQLAAAGTLLLYRDISAGSDSLFLDYWKKIKTKWHDYKYKKNIQPIIDRLKEDKDIQNFLKQPISKQRSGWINLINSKLLDNEKQYLKKIHKTKF